MWHKNKTFIFITFLTLTWVLQIGGCTTTPVESPTPLEPPAYAQVPHPNGTDFGDLISLFTDKTAPQGEEFPKECDSDFRALKKSTDSIDEINRGIIELVTNDPVHYHWCFYAKLMDLEIKMKNTSYIDERQKEVLNTFEFLTPIARAFNTQFHESRYLRWATHKYQRISEWVFYRRLDLTPRGTAELVEATQPLGSMRTPSGRDSVLQKYHLGTSSSFVTAGPANILDERPVPAPLPSLAALPSPLIGAEYSSEPPLPIDTARSPSPTVSPEPSPSPSFSPSPSSSPETEPTYNPLTVLPSPNVGN